MTQKMTNKTHFGENNRLDVVSIHMSSLLHLKRTYTVTSNENYVCTEIQLYTAIALLHLHCDFRTLQLHSSISKSHVMSNTNK